MKYVVKYTMEDVLDYGVFYKIQYPKSRTHPLSRPGSLDKKTNKRKRTLQIFPPSLNICRTMIGQAYSAYKNKWKLFGIWLAQKNKIDKLYIDKCSIIFYYHKKSKRKFDLDNFVPKMLMDGFVEAGVFIDDNITHIRPMILDGEFDAKEDMVEIIIDVRRTIEKDQD